MTKLDRLIAELCPDGVEYKPLGEIGEFVRGSGLQKKDFCENGVGCIHYGQIYTYYGIFTDRTKSFVSPQLAKTLKKVQTGDLIIASTSENVEDVCKTVAWLGTDEIVTGGHSTIFKHNQDPKYLAYYFTTQEFFDDKRKYARGTKVIDISAKDLAKIRVPLPPLSIQQEIVRILDKFTTLEAELEARKKQYEYYRNELLTFGDDVPMVTLGEITNMKAGKFVQATDIFDKQDDDNCYPCYGGNGLRGFVKSYNQEGSFSLIGRQGALCGNVKRVQGKFYATEHAVVVDAVDGINKDWLFHMLFHMNLNQYASKSAQPGLAVGNIEKLIISVPPLSEQARIVAILDRFDALTNDIRNGLPAEISARRKQYEYYRDKLLNFNRLNESIEETHHGTR